MEPASREQIVLACLRMFDSREYDASDELRSLIAREHPYLMCSMRNDDDEDDHFRSESKKVPITFMK